VLGAGSSAFDNAIAAIDHGSAQVDLFSRRNTITREPFYTWARFSGFLNSYIDLPDAHKWELCGKFLDMGDPPFDKTVDRAERKSQFTMHLAEDWVDIQQIGNEISILTETGSRYTFDKILLGTGTVMDMSAASELRSLLPHIALWKDKYHDDERDIRGKYPYLGAGMELQEREQGCAPYLNSIYVQTPACMLSGGFHGIGLSGIKYGSKCVVNALVRQLFLENYNSLKDEFDAIFHQAVLTRQKSGLMNTKN
jgi:cation diffusion facilitator CzcD-associated flavoprotein CzcO